MGPCLDGASNLLLFTRHFRKKFPFRLPIPFPFVGLNYFDYSILMYAKLPETVYYIAQIQIAYTLTTPLHGSKTMSSLTEWTFFCWDNILYKIFFNNNTDEGIRMDSESSVKLSTNCWCWRIFFIMYSLFYTLTCIELLLAGLRLGGYSFSIHEATSGSHPSWLGSM